MQADLATGRCASSPSCRARGGTKTAKTAYRDGVEGDFRPLCQWAWRRRAAESQQLGRAPRHRAAVSWPTARTGSEFGEGEGHRGRGTTPRRLRRRHRHLANTNPGRSAAVTGLDTGDVKELVDQDGAPWSLRGGGHALDTFLTSGALPLRAAGFRHPGHSGRIPPGLDFNLVQVREKLEALAQLAGCGAAGVAAISEGEEHNHGRARGGAIKTACSRSRRKRRWPTRSGSRRPRARGRRQSATTARRFATTRASRVDGDDIFRTTSC